MRSVRVMITFILAVCGVISICCAQQKQEPVRRDGQLVVKGRYINKEYGYSVQIPDQLLAYRLTGSAPQHGITLVLSRDDQIWINSEYDALMLGSAEAFAKRAAQMFYTGDHLKIVRNSPIELSGLVARDLLLERESGEGKTNYAHFLVGYRSVPNGVGIAYMIVLQTHSKNTAYDRLFPIVSRSFHLTTLVK